MKRQYITSLPDGLHDHISSTTGTMDVDKKQDTGNNRSNHQHWEHLCPPIDDWAAAVDGFSGRWIPPYSSYYGRSKDFHCFVWSATRHLLTYLLRMLASQDA